jgi:hypothetical protein
MSYKLTLIEYDQDIFEGDEMNPDIEYRDYESGVLGKKELTDEITKENLEIKLDTQMSDLHNYLIGISSSSSSSYSSSFSSSSSSSSSESPYKSFYIYSNVRGIYFKPDGTRFYAVAVTGEGIGAVRIYEYSLSTAWDIDTMSFVQQSDALTDLDPYGYRGLCFNGDGTEIFLGGMYSYPDGFVRSKSLSTAWDVSTIGSNTDFVWVTGYPKSIRFEEDGDYMYVMSYLTTPDSNVLEYTLSSSWTLTGALQTQSTAMGSYDTAEQRLAAVR